MKSDTDLFCCFVCVILFCVLNLWFLFLLQILCYDLHDDGTNLSPSFFVSIDLDESDEGQRVTSISKLHQQAKNTLI